MKKHSILMLVALIATVSLGVSAGQKASSLPGQIIRVGEFHGDEIKAKTGETWLGLFPEKDGFKLIPVKIKVEKIHDVVIDEKDEKTGKKVSVDRAGEPLFLCKGLSRLSPGPVKTIFFGDLSLMPGQEVSLRLSAGDDDYTIIAASQPAGDSADNHWMENYSLTLRRGEIDQELASVGTARPGEMPRLLWAGDLDRDGKLDLLLDLTDHYNVMHYALFLSSFAKPGRLLEKVAEFITVGC